MTSRLLALTVGLLMAAGAMARAAELDSPRATLKAFHTAIRDADREAFNACLLDRPQRAAYSAALFDLLTGVTAFQKAITERFGQEGLDVFQEGGGAIVEPFPTGDAWLERMQIDIRDDEATARDPERLDASMRLVKRDGRWLIDLFRDEPGRRPGDPETELAVRFLEGFATALRAIANDVAEGRHDTPEAVRDALTARLQAVRVELVEALMKQPLPGEAPEPE